MTSETTTAKQPWFCPPDLSGSRIGSLMGHSDIHSTARYVRATERNKQEAVEGRCSVLSSCPQIGQVIDDLLGDQ